MQTQGLPSGYLDELQLKWGTAPELAGPGPNQRPVSSLRRDEFRKAYRDIQRGGDVPYGGLKQPAPERNGKILFFLPHS